MRGSTVRLRRPSTNLFAKMLRWDGTFGFPFFETEGTTLSLLRQGNVCRVIDRRVQQIDHGVRNPASCVQLCGRTKSEFFRALRMNDAIHDRKRAQTRDGAQSGYDRIAILTENRRPTARREICGERVPMAEQANSARRARCIEPVQLALRLQAL